MSGALVSIVRGSEPRDMVFRALEMIEAEKALRNDRVLIKPNYVVAKDPSTGVTTDARVLEGIIKFLEHKGFGSIIIGEGGGFTDTFKAFKLAGVDQIASRYQVELVDLNRDEFIEVEIPDAVALKRVKIAKRVLESQVVSVPKLKIHSIAKVTLSLKNMMGAISPKGVMHGRLHEKIVDLVSVVKPRLAVIDGIVGGAGSELGSRPVEMNIVIASKDPVAVDAVGAAVMGLEPSEVFHIRLAGERGLGVSNLDEIEVVGESVEDIRMDFRRISNPRTLYMFARMYEASRLSWILSKIQGL